MGRNYLLYILTIIAGGSMAHSLVPPTPGPLFVAYELGVDIGLAIICGTIVGVFTTTAGYLWARFISNRITIPLRDSEDLSKSRLEAMAQRSEDELPSLLASILPILIPLFLLAGGTIFSLSSSKMEVQPDWMGTIYPIVKRDPFLYQAIHMRSIHVVMAQSGDGIESLLIRNNEDDVWSLIHAALKNN